MQRVSQSVRVCGTLDAHARRADNGTTLRVKPFQVQDSAHGSQLHAQGYVVTIDLLCTDSTFPVDLAVGMQLELNACDVEPKIIVEPGISQKQQPFRFLWTRQNKWNVDVDALIENMLNPHAIIKHMYDGSNTFLIEELLEFDATEMRKHCKPHGNGNDVILSVACPFIDILYKVTAFRLQSLDIKKRTEALCYRSKTHWYLPSTVLEQTLQFIANAILEVPLINFTTTELTIARADGHPFVMDDSDDTARTLRLQLLFNYLPIS